MNVGFNYIHVMRGCDECDDFSCSITSNCMVLGHLWTESSVTMRARGVFPSTHNIESMHRSPLALSMAPLQINCI